MVRKAVLHGVVTMQLVASMSSRKRTATEVEVAKTAKNNEIRCKPSDALPDGLLELKIAWN